MQTCFAYQDVALEEVRARLGENTDLVQSNKTLLATISERIGWFGQLGTGMKRFMYSVMVGQLATFREVVKIRTAVEIAIPRSLDEDPFLLEDPTGRVAPVHLRFIVSWDAFFAVLQCRFQEGRGLQKIRRRQFVLQDRSTCKEIDLSSGWETAFLPGQRVDMSFIFWEPSHRYMPPDCPYCHAPSSKPPGTRIQW